MALAALGTYFVTAHPPASATDLEAFRYGSRTIRRAERSLHCSPFRPGLFVAMQASSVPLLSMVGKQGLDRGYSLRPLSELGTESYLLWLIQTGVLRREVDGQGITDSFRLTPLGHYLVGKYSHHGKFPQVSVWDRFYNAWQRWIRLPI
jgi:hypothetical protein